MSNTKVTIFTVAALLVGLAIGFNISGSEAKNTLVSWKYGDAELKIDLEKDMADDQTLLGKIFSEQFSAAGARGWLKETQGLFPFNDPALASKLSELSFDDPAARELRALRNRRIGPWAYQAKDVNIGVPSRDDQPYSGHANVCGEGIFYRQRVEIFLPDSPDKRITVEATGRYACPKGYTFADIQLSREDAMILFGSDNFRMLEPAAAVVVQQ